MKIQQTPLGRMTYPMLRLLLECHLEHWQGLVGDDIYKVAEGEKAQAELLSDIFNELARRL